MIGFISTRGRDRVSFREAVLSGIAADGGLYMPERIPVWKKNDLRSFQSLPYHELAHAILFPYMKGHIGEDESLSICRDAFDFPVPLVHLYDNLFTLELFHGSSVCREYVWRYAILPERSARCRKNSSLPWGGISWPWR